MTKAQELAKELENNNNGEGVTVDMPRYVTVEGTVYMRGDLAHGLEGALDRVLRGNEYLLKEGVLQKAYQALANAKGDNDGNL